MKKRKRKKSDDKRIIKQTIGRTYSLKNSQLEEFVLWLQQEQFYNDCSETEGRIMAKQFDDARSKNKKERASNEQFDTGLSEQEEEEEDERK